MTMLALVKPGIKRMLDGMSQTAAQSSYVRRLMFNELRLRTDNAERLRELEELRFLAHIFNNREGSQSQILQDLWVTYETGGAQGGFFVEFGATNGKTNSNTWLLEKTFGWKGILAEPNPIWHQDLARNRSCAIEHRCVSSRSGETVDFVVTDDPELSTIAAYAEGDHFAGVRRLAPRISVPTLSLNDLLVEHGAPARVDYLSIDTEGSEFEILKQFDFARFDVRLFTIEHNNTPSEQAVQDLLESHGYQRKFPEFSQWDAWYVKE